MTSNKEFLNFFDEDFYIHGDFDETISTRIIPNIVKEIAKQEVKKDGKIRFFINSRGGYCDSLKEILGHVERAKKRGIIVETHVFGVALSCGSMLAVAGSKGHRYAGEYAEHLCHLGQAWSFSTNDKELERESQRVKSHFNFVRHHYAKHCKIRNLDDVISSDRLFIRGQRLVSWGS